MSTTSPTVTHSFTAQKALIAAAAAGALLFAAYAAAQGYVETPNNAVGWAATAATNPLMAAVEGGVVVGKQLAHHIAGH